ncbi:MAG TPA: hypothetical protein VNW46_09365 [Gemmatimonadaceae bacterium]|jgi:hypothetical protein|nr:hypothetical protein [Gemmatimonadaceae bacterium]
MSWIDSCTPAPPAALAERIQALVTPRIPAGRSVPGPDEYMDAADALLHELLRGECTSRTSAIDLLVVDALVTYAFEVASSDPARVTERARDAMRRIAALAMPDARSTG